MSAALDRLRGMVYRLGFRPRLGSILYSPSRAWRRAGRSIVDGLLDVIE